MQEKQINKKGCFISNIKERERYDKYEMQEDYDFSEGTRGRFYKPKRYLQH